MKLAVFVKIKEGYVVFPEPLDQRIKLIDFPDGKRGFYYAAIFGGGYENPYWQFWQKYKDTKLVHIDCSTRTQWSVRRVLIGTGK